MTRWQPTAEFYEKNPLAAEIRGICLDITDEMEKIIHDPEVARNPEVKSRLVRRIDALQNRLIELGITPNIHAGHEEAEYKRDPLMTAQYLAGQLVALFAEELENEQQAGPIAEEFNQVSVSKERQVYTVDLREVPDKLRRFATDMQFVTTIQKFLAAPKSVR